MTNITIQSTLFSIHYCDGQSLDSKDKEGAKLICYLKIFPKS